MTALLPVTALVVAKAPVPGQVKTRLAAAVGDVVATDLAAAALIDTLDAVAETPFAARVLALAGDLEQSAYRDEILSHLKGFHVVGQRGRDFAERLVHAHADAAEATGCPAILQLGMDTPQVTVDLLMRCARRLESDGAVLGPARDGGWWVLGVSDAQSASCLRDVPMSQPDTGALTAAALVGAGVSIGFVEELTDVDTIEDVDAVWAACPPTSRFARAARGV